MLQRKLLAGLCFALIAFMASPLYAANAYISEYAALTATSSGGSSAQIAALPALASQKVAFTGTPGTSAAFGGATKYIRLHCDAACSFLVNGTAAVTDARMPADGIEYFGVQPGQTISVIANP